MDQKNIKYLLDKYLAGSCTEQEKEQVDNWVEQLKRENNEWSLMTPLEQKDYLKKLYKTIAHTLYNKEKKPSAISKVFGNIRSRYGHFPFVRLAASLIVLVSLLSILYFIGPAIYNSFNSVSYSTQTTPPGKTKKIVLNDGTIVWLNVASKLRYPEKFNQKSREVFLDGEAYFEIKHDNDHPFIIHTQQMNIRDIGTAFNVCAYPADENVQVAVISGKVKVSLSGAKNKKGNLLLTANELANYEKADGKLSKKNIPDAADYTGWRNGKLSFHHTSMAEVVHKLERTFDFKIIIKNDAINHCKIFGDFDLHQPPEQLIKIICLSIGAKYEIKGKLVTIKGPGCK